jgi:hypothetical protein
MSVEFNFEGTFELCDTEADMYEDVATKGLTDTEEHIDSELYPDASGGTLGEFFTGGGTLPI